MLFNRFYKSIKQHVLIVTKYRITIEAISYSANIH